MKCKIITFGRRRTALFSAFDYADGVIVIKEGMVEPWSSEANGTARRIVLSSRS